MDRTCLYDLPQYSEIVERFGVFGGDEAGCSPQVLDDGAVRCLCDGCKEWKVIGSVRATHAQRCVACSRSAHLFPTPPRPQAFVEGAGRDEHAGCAQDAPGPADWPATGTAASGGARPWELDRRPQYEVLLGVIHHCVPASAGP